MPLTILNVAYPLAPVGPDAVGGAEQILTHLDAGLVRAGHESLVVAADGSKVEGKLIPVPPSKGTIDHRARQRAWQLHRAAIRRVLDQWPVDLVHLHGIDCLAYLPPAGVPALVTLHLPPHWYPPEIFSLARPETYLHCVSTAQRETCPPCDFLLPEIPNGVPADLFQTRHARRRFALSLGRICPEKGFHHALKAAEMAQLPLWLGGTVFAYPAHQAYFQTEIAPRLGPDARFLGPVGWHRKRRLLSAARCLLVPSLVPETSSLVAMEALACDTPVIAYRAGALAEIVEHGKTGFLVANPSEMAEAIRECDTLPKGQCRAKARVRFSLEPMLQAYFTAYHRLASRGRHRQSKGVEWIASWS